MSQGEPDNRIPEQRPGTKFCSEIPLAAGRVVAVTEFEGMFFVACEHAVFRYVDDQLISLKFKV